MARTKGAKDKKKRKRRAVKIAGAIAGAAILGVGVKTALDPHTAIKINNAIQTIRTRVDRKGRRDYRKYWAKRDAYEGKQARGLVRYYESEAKNLQDHINRNKKEWVKYNAKKWREHKSKLAAGEQSTYAPASRLWKEYEGELKDVKEKGVIAKKKAAERRRTRRKRYFADRKKDLGFSSPVFLSDF